MKNVMKNAWAIARMGAKKFGGSAKLYFVEALRLAWADSRAPKVETVAEKVARAKAMSQEEFDAIVDLKIGFIVDGMKKHILFLGRNMDWVKREVSSLVEEGIAQMRKERIISVEKAAFLSIDKYY
ncbi:hypothetical protein C1I60_14040 [Paenibacillus terrae]|uniref:Uncharacterized protein n=1 Tax=Paenibacillus terrae TaxID=159743 RepID=A0A4U2Q1F5_9BACL|nr:hypothetical protein [Paenibacillus terrae]TKH43414.1 hypothetical protein C1I60_14040 [Paenibacillus terrae]